MKGSLALALLAAGGAAAAATTTTTNNNNTDRGVFSNARGSSGCGKSPAASAGSTTAMTGTFGGIKRKWRVNVPKSYSKNVAAPLVVSTHGWGGNGLMDELGSGLSKTGGGQITVYPDGMGDNFQVGFWGSWNAVGSTQSPGPDGQICDPSADKFNTYCYTSCKGCKGSDGCDWTTCTNDITPTGIGTKDVTGFLPQLYDFMEENFCIDVTREYHTGMSNGAMMTYQVGVSMASRVAAIVPNAGSFHRGFAAAPASKVPLLDLHGTRDKTVPANETSSTDGWHYTKTKDIVQLWTKANGCAQPKAAPYKGPIGVTSAVASRNKLGCVDWGCDTVTCAHNGGHDYFGSAADNGKLTWAFLSQYQKPAHIGRGLVVGQEEELELLLNQQASEIPRLSEVSIVEDEGQEAALAKASLPIIGITIDDDTDGFDFEGEEAEMPEAATAEALHGRRAYYGDPLQPGGCRPGEDVIKLQDGRFSGHVCAARRNAGVSADASNLSPQCTLGGVVPDATDGCPTRLPLVNHGNVSAFPQCARDAVDDDDQSAHCFLTCDPCRSGNTSRAAETCSTAAHNMCPKGSLCMTGLLRNMRLGFCAFPTK